MRSSPLDHLCHTCVLLKMEVGHVSWSLLGPWSTFYSRGPLCREASSHMEGLSTFPTPFPAGLGLCAANLPQVRPQTISVEASLPLGTEFYSPEYKGRVTPLVCSYSCGWNRNFQQRSSEPIIYLSGVLQTRICLSQTSMGDELHLIGSVPFIQWPSTGAGAQLCLLRIGWLDRWMEG